ncbi:hypothetical protein D9M72_579700 [compost metagenome]
MIVERHVDLQLRMQRHEAGEHRRKDRQPEGEGGVDPQPAIDLSGLARCRTLQLVEFVEEPAALGEVTTPGL